MARRKKSGENKGESAVDVVDAAPSPPEEEFPLEAKGDKTPPGEPSTSALIISRNKHWRYISSFHGPWLQLPPEILESLAYSNYASPQPQPVDAAVFFDLIKIRRLIEEATDLAVRAANGTAAPPGNNLSGTGYGLLGKGNGPVPGAGMRGLRGDGTPKLSRERRHRMREHASQKLAKAYALDEIAASVATMQSASALEQVAKLVLQRNEDDCDAKYVHFFHEKIPSRSLAQCTSLEPLDDIIATRQLDGAVYRTRAVAKMLKDDLPGAIRDLTDGLAACRSCARLHAESKREVEVVSEKSRQKPIPIRFNPKVDEKDQPRGLEGQLLFHRAGVYLSIACQNIHDSLSFWEQSKDTPDAANGADEPKEDEEADEIAEPQSDSPSNKQANRRRWLEGRKVIKLNARRALHDYLTFLASISYTPGPSSETQPDGSVNRIYKVYQVSSLFSPQPPPNLPPFPDDIESLALLNKNGTNGQPQQQKPRNPKTCNEAVTYHPLLTDALHSILLCHSLLQTPEKEFLRHAHMVARVARICDGYPIFLAPRSPARADWMEILYRTDNWLKLKQPWEVLCAPSPLPNNAALHEKGSPEAKAAEAEYAGRDLVQAGLQKGYIPEEERHKQVRPLPRTTHEVFKRWAQDDGKDFALNNDRAESIAWWIRMAPTSVGTGQSKGKKTASKKKKKNSDCKETAAKGDEGEEADLSVQNLTIG